MVELPSLPTAAVLVHRGEMARIGDSWMHLTDQLVADGYRMTGPTREVYLLTVHAQEENRTIGIFESFTAVRAAVAEVVSIPEYEGQPVRIAYLQYGDGECGASVGMAYGRQEIRAGEGGRGMLVIVQKLDVRRNA